MWSKDDTPTPQPSPRLGGGGTGEQPPPTAVGAEPPGDQELLIVNRTSDVWLVHHGSAFLCRLVPKQEHVARVSRAGTIRAELDGSPDIRLQIDLQPHAWGLEIVDDGYIDDGFALRLLRRQPRLADTMPSSAVIEDLGLRASTENALKRLGILTIDDALRTPVDSILAVPRYPLTVLFDLAEQLHGLNVT